MITVYTTDKNCIYSGSMDVDPYGPMPPNSALTAPPETTGSQVAKWIGDQWVVLDEMPDPEPGPSQFQLDESRYRKRAAVKDDLIAYMAADNMSRVRSGTWTVPSLMSLMGDPDIVAANAYMSALSFELATQAIAGAASPLLTPQIRADWTSKLQAHFYLEG